MAYFDIDDTATTPDTEAENRRKVLAAIASAGKPMVLGQPARDSQPNVPAPRLTPVTPPDMVPTWGGTSSLGGGPLSQPTRPPQPTPPPARLTPAQPPDVGGPTFSGAAPLGQPVRPTRPDVMPTREDFPVKPLPTWEKVLGIAAAPFLPNLTTNLLGGPQREASRQYGQAVQDYERGQTGRVREAQLANIASEIKTRENPPDKTKEEDWSVLPGVTGPNGELIQQEKNSGQVRYVSGVTGQKKTAETQEQNKLSFQNVIAKVDQAGLPTDPKNLPRSLDQAVRRGAIKPEEHQSAAAYLAANPTPSTTVQVQTTGAETKQAIHDANTYYRWSDASGIHAAKGNKVPAGVDAEPIGGEKEFATHLREGRAANIVQQSLNRIAQDVDEHPELFDSAAARNILATSLQQIDRSHAAILVAGTGGSIPIPSGLGQMINTALQNRALDAKTARAVKDYVADYKAMKDKAIVQQMEMQGGKIGRGSTNAFEAIVNQLPNGDTADSTTARRQVANMQATQDELAKNYGEFGDFKKEKPYQLKTGGGQGDKVNVIAPDGTPGTIPRANLQKALKQGYRQQ